MRISRGITPEERVAMRIKTIIEDYDLYELIRYGDLGLPLAHFMHHDLVILNEESTRLINETYAILVEFLELDANEDFETFQQMINELESQDS